MIIFKTNIFCLLCLKYIIKPAFYTSISKKNRSSVKKNGDKLLFLKCYVRDRGAEMRQGPWCGDVSGAVVWRCIRGHCAEMHQGPWCGDGSGVRGHGAEMGQGPWCGDGPGAMVRRWATDSIIHTPVTRHCKLV